MTEPEQVAWAAELFEGEGSLFVNNVGTFPQARATLVTTDLDVLERFASVMGVGRIIPQKSYKPHHKQRYRWSVDSKADFQKVVFLLEPHLGTRRRDQLKRVLQTMARYDLAKAQRACARRR